MIREGVSSRIASFLHFSSSVKLAFFFAAEERLYSCTLSSARFIKVMLNYDAS